MSLGESDRQEQHSQKAPGIRFDSFAIRIGIGILVAGQSMIFGLAINLEEQTPHAVKLGVQGVILAGTLLVMAPLKPSLFRIKAVSELRRNRLTIEVPLFPADHDGRDVRVNAIARVGPRADLFRSCHGIAGGLRAGQGNRRAQPRRGDRHHSIVGVIAQALPHHRLSWPRSAIRN